MRRALALPFLLAALAPLSAAIVIVPPVAYFLTLSLGTFLANSLVSLLVFGVLKGATARTYAGRSVYEILYQLMNACLLMLLAFPCMFLAAIAFNPIEQSGFVASGLSAGLLALAAAGIVSLKEFRASDAGRKRTMVASLLAFAAFVAAATTVSAALAVTVYRVA